MPSSKSDKLHNEHGYTIADIPLDADPDVVHLLADLTLDMWLEEARKDYVLLRLSSVLASQGDAVLGTQVRAIDSPEIWSEFLDGLDQWRTRCRGIMALCDAAEARLLIALARLRR